MTRSLCILVACDSFKGSTGGAEAAEAIARGWKEVRPEDVVMSRGVADGGEGTAAVVLQAVHDVERVKVLDVPGPDHATITSEYLRFPDGTALVELARTSGLTLLQRPDPLHACTCGTGEVIGAALHDGATRIVIALGGSATVDGGVGLLRALGLRVLDSDGRSIPHGGGFLHRASTIDGSDLLDAPAGGVTALVDVVNPLLGPDGAVAVYGPQKGADLMACAVLERGLTRIAELAGGDVEMAGGGAAGGTAYGLAMLWSARLARGAEAILTLTKTSDDVARSDVVVIGEGSFDRSSLDGKVTGALLACAERHERPAFVVAGRADAGVHDRVLTLEQLAGSVVGAMEDPHRWLQQAGRVVAMTPGLDDGKVGASIGPPTGKSTDEVHGDVVL